MPKKVHVVLNYEIWKELAKLKIERDLKTMNDVVKMLLSNFKEKENVGERRVSATN